MTLLPSKADSAEPRHSSLELDLERLGLRRHQTSVLGNTQSDSLIAQLYRGEAYMRAQRREQELSTQSAWDESVPALPVSLFFDSSTLATTPSRDSSAAASTTVSPNTSPSFVAERRSRRMQASRDNLHNILHIATNALENGLDFAAIDDIIEEAGQAADDDDDDNYNNHFGNDNSIDDYGDRSLQ